MRSRDCGIMDTDEVSASVSESVSAGKSRIGSGVGSGWRSSDNSDHSSWVVVVAIIL